MADLRVSDLPALDAVDVEAVDPLLISDISASESKKIDVKSLVTAGVGLMENASIDPGKISYPLPNDVVDGDAVIDNSLPGDKIEDSSIQKAKIADGAVDTAQLADGAVVDSKLERLSVTGGASGAIAQHTITEENLAENSVGTDALKPIEGDALADATITSDKIASVDGSTIIDRSITTTKIASGAITNVEIAQNAIGNDNIYPGSILGGDGGNIAADTITDWNLADGAVGAQQLKPIGNESIADGTIDSGKFAPTAVDRGLDVDTGAIGHTSSIEGTTHNGLTFDDHGHIVDTSDLQPSDLPVATDVDLGGVIVPTDSGLSVTSNGELSHTNTTTGETVSGIEFDDNGHILSAIPLQGDDLPAATETDLGGVSVPGPALEVTSDGELSHALVDGLIADTYTKVTVDERGHVVSGEQLSGNDVPPHDASLIQSGTFPVNQALDAEGNPFGDTLALADNSITARHVRDYSTTLMQEENPGAVDRYGDPHFLGRYWYRPSNSQLYIYARGSSGLIWLPVGFGVITEQNLRFAGTYNATDSTIQTLSSYGVTAGLEAGSNVPLASDALAGIYLVCQTPGNGMLVPDLQDIDHQVTDWVVCLGTANAWIHVDNASGGPDDAGARTLNELLDVSLDDGTLDTRMVPSAKPEPFVSLQEDQLLKYNSADGMWRNTSRIDCGTF